jgi:hypothetical protein
MNLLTACCHYNGCILFPHRARQPALSWGSLRKVLVPCELLEAPALQSPAIQRVGAQRGGSIADQLAVPTSCNLLPTFWREGFQAICETSLMN